jgi:hypothetical protein
MPVHSADPAELPYFENLLLELDVVGLYPAHQVKDDFLLIQGQIESWALYQAVRHHHFKIPSRRQLIRLSYFRFRHIIEYQPFPPLLILAEHSGCGAAISLQAFLKKEPQAEKRF